MSKPNDDRSNSMNPNNEAYHASERNRATQLGRNYEDDEEQQRQLEDDWWLHQENERLRND